MKTCTIAIVSMIPKEIEPECFRVVSQTLTSIAQQELPANWKTEILFLDDGSDFTSPLHQSQIVKLTETDIGELEFLRDKNFKAVYCAPKSDIYGKAELLNHALKLESVGDLFVLLDDDHVFTDTTCLKKAIAGYEAGYSFLMGKLYSKDHVPRSYYDHHVQGSTVAMSREFLHHINYFGEAVKDWGCGEDSEILWRAYSACTQNAKWKAAYVPDFATIDSLSGRWQYCQKKIGGESVFRTGFQRQYGVDPKNNPSRNKITWMDYFAGEKLRKQEPAAKVFQFKTRNPWLWKLAQPLRQFYKNVFSQHS